MKTIAVLTTAAVIASSLFATGCAGTKRGAIGMTAAGVATSVVGGALLAHRETCEERSLFGGDTGSASVTNTVPCRDPQYVIAGLALAVVGAALTGGGLVSYALANDAPADDLALGVGSDPASVAALDLQLPGARRASSTLSLSTH